MPAPPAAKLFALSREAARTMFGCREPEALRAFLETELPQLVSEEQRVEIGSVWGPLRAACAAADEDTAAGFFPELRLILLGGRELQAGPNYEVRLMRPDAVPKIAADLAALFPEQRRERIAAEPALAAHVEEALGAVEEITRLYGQAASAGACVLLVVELT